MRHSGARTQTIAIGLYLLVFVSGLPLAHAENALKPEDLLQKHLDSIGSSAVRGAVKTRAVQGDVVYKVLVGGSGEMRGNAVLASEERKSHILLKVNAQQYHGERFITNGDKAYVAGTYNDKTRSEFGEFLRGEDLVIREGLLGGTLTTAWPLMDLEGRKGKLITRGQKKVDGVTYETAIYKPKKSLDLEITLFFDPVTFHHMMTFYTVSQGAGILAATDGGEERAARQQETRYRIEERFSDFKTSDGLTLPSHYDLRFTEELQNGFTKSIEWDLTVNAVSNNIPIDAKNFVLP